MSKNNIAQGRKALLQSAISKRDVEAINEILHDLGTNIYQIVADIDLPKDFIDSDSKMKLQSMVAEQLFQEKPSNSPQIMKKGNPVVWSFDREKK